MADSKYAKRSDEESRLREQLDIQALEKMVSGMSAEKRKMNILVVGDRTFSPNQILDEAKKGSKYGKMFVAAQQKLRTEQMRRV